VPSLASIWSVAVLGALVCFAFTYFFKWWGSLSLIPFLCGFVLYAMEMHSADIGPALYAEQGSGYFVQTYCAMALVLLGAVIGLLSAKRGRGDVQKG